MGGQSVDPGQYISKPDNTVETKTLQAKIAADNLNFDLGLLGFDQQAKSQERALKLAARLTPNMQQFDAAKTSKEAAEMGMANLARSKKFEQLVDPETAKMRSQIGKRVADATSSEALQKYMNDFAKSKGITDLGETGISRDSTIGRSAIFDQATQAARQFNLENLAAQQGYLAATEAPKGGLDPGALMEAKQAAESSNLANLTGWQQNIVNAARGMQVQSPMFVPTGGYQDILSLQQANQQNRQNYEQAMYQGAAQNAAGSNQMTGSLIGAGGAIGGAALGAVII